MSTLLKRNLCSIDGTVIIEDIGNNDVLPDTSKIDVMVDVVEYGVLEGYAWVEEHHMTWLPWILVLLFFWLIKPTVIKSVFVHLEQSGTIVDFDFIFDETKSLQENFISAPGIVPGVKEVWITTTH